MGAVRRSEDSMRRNWCRVCSWHRCSAHGCERRTPSDGGPPTRETIEITFAGDTVNPNGKQIDVEANEPMILVITADAPGEIHIHSTPSRRSRTPPARDSQGHHRRPGVVEVESHTAREGHRPARGSLDVHAADATGHGIGGPRTSRSRPPVRHRRRLAALAVSFTVLAVAWRKPRYDAATGGGPASAGSAAWSTRPRSRRRCGSSAWCCSSTRRCRGLRRGPA